MGRLKEAYGEGSTIVLRECLALEVAGVKMGGGLTSRRLCDI